jgi:hypothetical protein
MRHGIAHALQISRGHWPSIAVKDSENPAHWSIRIEPVWREESRAKTRTMQVTKARGTATAGACCSTL